MINFILQAVFFIALLIDFHDFGDEFYYFSMPEDDEIPEAESKIAPPTVQCPNCDSMLPNELGEVTCNVCTAVSRIEHKPTRESWLDEKIGCPNCKRKFNRFCKKS